MMVMHCVYILPCILSTASEVAFRTSILQTRKTRYRVVPLPAKITQVELRPDSPVLSPVCNLASHSLASVSTEFWLRAQRRGTEASGDLREGF